MNGNSNDVCRQHDCSEDVFHAVQRDSLLSGNSTEIYGASEVICPWCGSVVFSFRDLEYDQIGEGKYKDRKCHFCGNYFTLTVHAKYSYDMTRG